MANAHVRRRFGLGIAVFCAGAAIRPDEACARAWSQDPGHALEISTISRENSQFGEAWRADYLVEYGLATDWTLRLRVEEELRLKASAGTKPDRGNVEFGVRRSFSVAPRLVISAEASILGGQALEGLECTGEGYEFRGGGGASRKLGGMETFVAVEGAYRRRGDACARTLYQISSGVEPVQHLRLIAKGWTQDGRSPERYGVRSSKVELTAMYDLPKFSVGFGARREVSGAFKETGVLLALWRRY